MGMLVRRCCTMAWRRTVREGPGQWKAQIGQGFERQTWRFLLRHDTTAVMTMTIMTFQ